MVARRDTRGRKEKGFLKRGDGERKNEKEFYTQRPLERKKDYKKSTHCSRKSCLLRFLNLVFI